MHDENSLHYGHNFTYLFDVNTGIWWHCDDVEISQISGFIDIVYTR